MLLALWQGAAMALEQDFILPSPIAVFLRLLRIWQIPQFGSILAGSALHILGGFALALVLGLLLGVLAGRFPLVELFFSPFALCIKSVPVASFIVICLVWLSSSKLSLFISFLMALPVLYGHVLTGMRSVSRELWECVHVFALSPLRRLRYLWLPTLRPQLLAACSLGMGLAWKAGIAAEVIGIPPGSIGRMFYDAKLYLNSTDLFAWTTLVVLLSLLAEKLICRGLALLLRKMEGL